VKHAGVTAKIGDDAEVDSASVVKYVSTESQVLLHHAAETVVRLFLAHRDTPPCPWLEMAGETIFWQFKDRVDREIVQHQRPGVLEAQAALAFLGRREAGPAEDLDVWTDAAQNLAAFLRTVAERWLKEANVYNTMKHGLAVLPGNALFQLLDEDGKPLRLGEGVSVEFLEPTRWEAGRRYWQLTTKWLDVQESLGLVEIACMMIDSLWSVARCRYVGSPAAGQVFFPAGLKPADFRGQRSPVHTFSLKLLEERKQ
jgi:hypothetical protein